MKDVAESSIDRDLGLGQQILDLFESSTTGESDEEKFATALSAITYVAAQVIAQRTTDVGAAARVATLLANSTLKMFVEINHG